MRRLLIFALLMLAAPAFAQTAIPTDYTFQVFFEAAPNGAPLSTFDFAKAAAQCDQPVATPVPPVVANPRYMRFIDPERPTRECVFDTGATSGVLFAMPLGGRYVAKIVARVVVGGVSFSAPPSDVSNPFVRGAAPAAVTGLRIGG